MKTIRKIVLTGGPCSGKSTFMTLAQQLFTKYGYHVFVDHEAATDLISGNLSPATMGMYQFQKYVITLQLAKENIFLQAAEEIDKDRILIFYDRAILDDKGYVSDEEFSEILESLNIDESSLCNRYDLVLHMETSAKGSQSAYTLQNNEARYEDAQGAVAVDDTTLKAWSVHPNHIIISQESDIGVKLDKTVNAIISYLEKADKEA